MKVFRAQEAFRILVIAVMMACLASAATDAVSRLVSGFDPTPLVALAFLVCLEGIAGDRLARQLPEATARLRLRLAEWVVILLLLRLVLSLAQGFEAFALAITGWLARPQSLVDGGLLAAGLLLLVVWALGINMSRTLEALDPEADAPPPRDSAAYYAWLTRPRAAQRASGWQQLGGLFLGGGVLVLFFSGAARLDVQAVLSLRNPAIAGIVGNALLYFVLGFTLLAQGHYAMLRSRWERGEVEVARSLARRWIVLGLAFALGVAVAVLLLPTRPSLALFRAVFDAVWWALYYAMGFVLVGFALLGYLFSLLGRLLGSPGGQGSESPSFTMPPPPPETPAQRVAWWEAIQGFVLWAIIVAVLVYALIRFVRERRGLWSELAGRGGPLGWLAGVIVALWRWLGRVGARVGASWRALASRPPAQGRTGEGGARLRWWRPRTLREQVRLFYLLGLQETGRAGWPRKAADTPYEYARRVQLNLDQGQQELGALTEAFVQARFGRREFGPAEVGPLRVALRRLRSICRRIAGLGRPSGAADDIEVKGENDG